MEFDRRQILRGAGALAGLSLISARAQGAVKLSASPVFASEVPRTLVLLQFAGGNDGLSTVVPFADDGYNAARRATRIAEKDVLRLDDYRGFHPELKRMHAAWQAGKLAVIEGAGYANPIRSHFKSYEIWHTADERGRAAGEGWIGRLVNAAWPDDRDPNLVVHIGKNVPYSVYSLTHPAASFATPTGYKWAGDESERAALEKGGEICEHGEKADEKEPANNLEYLRKVLRDGQASSEAIRRAAVRYRTKTEYAGDELAQALRDVAALSVGQVGSRVFSLELSGFDTHSDQKNRHDALMRRLDASLPTFLADIAGTEAGKSTLVVAFSEFGRRVKENGSGGTDHGVAGPMFVAGEAVKGGLYGKHPSLTKLDDGDLVHTTDFRSVYATVIEKWFGVDASRVLRAKYPVLPLLKA
ncbi:MAG TPA: DUF1501 domain-containing protein [Planctomycetota bacterium]|nr:DUF1501 domain-containing protein [Planctomycetota bacterium]